MVELWRLPFPPKFNVCESYVCLNLMECRVSAKRGDVVKERFNMWRKAGDHSPLCCRIPYSAKGRVVRGPEVRSGPQLRINWFTIHFSARNIPKGGDGQMLAAAANLWLGREKKDCFGTQQRHQNEFIINHLVTFFRLVELH